MEPAMARAGRGARSISVGWAAARRLQWGSLVFILKAMGRSWKAFSFFKGSGTILLYVTQITQVAGGRGRARGGRGEAGRAYSRAPGSQHPPGPLFIFLHILLAERMGNPSVRCAGLGGRAVEPDRPGFKWLLHYYAVDLHVSFFSRKRG